MLKIAALLCLLVTVTNAEDHWANTQAPASARYEMLVINVPNTTFRLDKYTGQVANLVGNNPAEYYWKLIPPIEAPGPGNSPRYQLYCLNNYNNIFLLDVETGKAWRLGSDRDGYGWKPMPDNSTGR